MGKVLQFLQPQNRISAPTSSNEAYNLMLQASALLHQDEGEVEREIAWLLEDLVDFMNSPEPGTNTFHDEEHQEVSEISSFRDRFE
jgi:hypothetical protein